MPVKSDTTGQEQPQKGLADLPGLFFRCRFGPDQAITVLFVSLHVQTLLERSLTEIQQNPLAIWALIHPEDRWDAECSLMQSVKQTQPWQWTGRIITPTGQWRSLQLTAHPEVEETGEVLWHGMAIDITARQQADAIRSEEVSLFTLGAQVGVALGQGGLLPEILERCTDVIVQHLQHSCVRIWTLNGESGLLELQAIAGQSTYTEDFPSSIPLGISIIGVIAHSHQAYVSNNALHDICIGGKTWMQQEGLTAFAGYPLVVDDRLVGVMALFSPYPFSEAIDRVLHWVANSMALAIDRAWVREELLSRRESLLFQLASQIRNSLDLDTILATTVTEIRSLLQIDRCHFLWCWISPDQASLALTHEAHHPDLPSLLGEIESPQVDHLAQKILNLDIIRIDDVFSEVEINPDAQLLLTAGDITSQLLLPLETRSGQLGAIVCSHCSGPRPWLDSEVELLQAVTNQVAIAIDQAELYAQSRAATLAAQSQTHQLTEALHKLQETQAQLIQHEKMSSLGQLVAGVAHEINNPVNFISGNLVYAGTYIHDLLNLLHLYQENYPNPVPTVQSEADAIDVEFISEDLLKLLSSMQLGADRIRQIVLSLRNFSRLDEAEMKPVDIHEGIDNTLLILQNRLKSSTQSSGIEVIKHYGDLPLVDCYAGQLNQVFMNILSNALDVLEEQPEPRLITITTEIHGEVEPDLILLPDGSVSLSPPQNAANTPPASVVIRFRDTGPGMTEEVRSRLFDPFFTTKPVGKGTGLGLSISYQIVVEKHGGSLTCESQLGQGSEFTIEIPVKQP